jgi:Flp pilus assembly protein TadG
VGIKHGCRRQPDGGAVYIEFAIVVPLILLFIAGVYDTGRYFSQMSWLAQAGYQVARAGSVAPPGPSNNRQMRARYNQIDSVNHVNHIYSQTPSTPHPALTGTM